MSEKKLAGLVSAFSFFFAEIVFEIHNMQTDIRGGW